MLSLIKSKEQSAIMAHLSSRVHSKLNSKITMHLVKNKTIASTIVSKTRMLKMVRCTRKFKRRRWFWTQNLTSNSKSSNRRFMRKIHVLLTIRESLMFQLNGFN